MSTTTALLIIDVQQGFFEGSHPAYHASAVLDRISGLIAQARTADTQVLYIQHDGDPGGRVEPGSAGWQIHPRITPAASDLVIRKRAADAFYGTALHQELESGGIRHLVVAGYRTQYCVDTTCRRAVSLGYDVTLVADAHTTTDNEVLSAAQIIAHHNATLDDFGNDKHVVVAKETHQITF